MDKISKALEKLTTQEKQTVREILIKIKAKDCKSLNIKKLKGRDDIFRVRKGRVRILYQIDKSGEVNILAIERRSEKTYRRLPK